MTAEISNMTRSRPNTVSLTLEPAERCEIAEKISRCMHDHTKRTMESMKARKWPHVMEVGE